MSSVIEAIISSGIDERLNDSLMNSLEAREISERRKQSAIKFYNMKQKLPDEQIAIIDDYVGVCDDYTEIYGEMAYIQGMMDASEIFSYFCKSNCRSE